MQAQHENENIFYLFDFFLKKWYNNENNFHLEVQNGIYHT